jgi:uncharacterized protein YfaS (alpha-2-macroglobulin family)
MFASLLQVRVRFVDKVRRPGEPVQISLTAAPGSTVALSAVDKSVRLLREADDLDSDEVSYIKQLFVDKTEP